VEVRHHVDAEGFLALMDVTYSRGGKRRPFSDAYLRRLIERPGFSVVAVSAWAQGQLQAALLIPHDTHTAYFLHGASLQRPVTGSNVVCHWAAMRRLKERGVSDYDLGGARRETEDRRLSGIFRFKRHFGGPFVESVRWRLPLTPAGRLFLRFRHGA